VTDENIAHSGSRWEPATLATPRRPAAAADDDATPTPAAPGRRWGSSAARRRTAFAGAVVGLVAVGGLGGLALGHAATDGTGVQTGQVSQLRTSNDHPAFPGGGTRPPGTLPGRPPGRDLGEDLDEDLEGDGGPRGGDDDQGSGSGTTRPGSPT
jgi:hypothetical protein